MPIHVTCATCGTTLKAPDHLLGQRVKCSKCNSVLTVGSEPEVEPVVSVVPVYENEPRTGSSSSASKPTKACPFCGEDVLAVAKKCKHCGETLDVALRAAEESRRLAEMAGRSGGGGGAAAANTTVVIGDRFGPRPFPHVLHLVLTFFTCGLWLPVWIIHYLIKG